MRNRTSSSLWRGLIISIALVAPVVESGAAGAAAAAAAAASVVVAPQAGLQPGQHWTNSRGMKFVPVPGTPVLFSVRDTRVQDYEAFAAATGRAWQKPAFEQGPTHPAVCVSWDDAKAFCAWLTEKERRAGTLNATQEYRLPTDLEWSTAAGLPPETGNTPQERNGKVAGVYPWGAQWPPPRGAGNYHPSLNVDEFAGTSPVGSFAPNRFGLFDMGGNVWQWCEEFCDGQSGARVLRGGSWNQSDPGVLLSSYRFGNAPGSRYADCGFRCVLVIGGETQVVASAAASAAAGSHRGRRTNSLGMKFVPVPGTSVLFSIWDTRVQDYQAFVTATGRDWEKPLFEQGPTHPAVKVGWNNAKAFCAWLTEKERGEGRLGAQENYRLPTDAEWSVAVGLPAERGSTPVEKWHLWRKAWEEQHERGGETKWEDITPTDVYPWGNQWPPPRGAGNYHPELEVDDFPKTSPVGSFAANRYGLYDMGGNVWQMCEDFFGIDIPGIMGKKHAARGCSWLTWCPPLWGRKVIRPELLSAARGSCGENGTGATDFGFRIVLAGGGLSKSEDQSAAASAAAAAAVTVVVAPPPDVQPDPAWTNSLGMKFVPVAGTAARFSIWDTRVQDYQAFVTATGRAWPKPSFEQGATHPAVTVSWEDAKAFCAWLTEKERREGTLNATLEYRLPTDLEWSTAVGLPPETGGMPGERNGKVKDAYPWGAQWPPPRGAGNYGPALNMDDFANTSPVGSFGANRFGLYDMGGNVWQWCEDFCDSQSGTRVLRGGSWNLKDPGVLLSSYRLSNAPGARYEDCGFRCVLAGVSAR